MTNETMNARMYEQGNYANDYIEVPMRDPGRAWRDGMVSGNGENGYVTSGSPYNDSFIFQQMWFNFPSPHPRAVPEELTAQLEEARLNVFNLNDQWKIKDSRGQTRARTFYYSYHPGHQLRLGMTKKGSVSAYERWTNYETAETGVRYTDERGGVDQDVLHLQDGQRLDHPDRAFLGWREDRLDDLDRRYIGHVQGARRPHRGECAPL
ncbi:glycoside hydrolase family 95 protein [Cohnella ginsengisoli]|uniref:Glycoside hydrolase family 95 protein n=1 Tax=Cohnella ginsengisoli TaxID=425004 RepID=A0A9X4KGF9_9BACL|nr:glycoside hydrolase N-terminal domain-containing protein [Cohnella ginsengisoli]MDG0791530.1 glycoside hydrolase family 95 protein [Cohnella ginsengisoli]